MSKFSIVFMGTPEFAVSCLEMLVNEGYDVKGVVTKPDKPKGRGHKFVMPPVKVCAEKYGLHVFQPDKAKDGRLEAYLKERKPDFIITAAYGKILPGAVLNCAAIAAVNVHASLLPAYRGSAPIQYAIMNGDQKTGITIMHMDEGMDTGDVILKKEIAITDRMTGQELHDALSVLGAEALKEMLGQAETGKMNRTPQDHEQATYAPMLTKETGRIQWDASGRNIYDLIRGVNPWPGAYSYYKEELFKIWESEMIRTDGAETKGTEAPGCILDVNGEGICVKTGDGKIRITRVQFPSGKRMSVQEYLKGHMIEKGVVLGEQG